MKPSRAFYGTNVIQETWSGCQETIKEATRQGAPASLGRAPLSPRPLGHRLAFILLPKNHKYSNIILRPFSFRLDSV